MTRPDTGVQRCSDFFYLYLHELGLLSTKFYLFFPLALTFQYTITPGSCLLQPLFYSSSTLQFSPEQLEAYCLVIRENSVTSQIVILGIQTSNRLIRYYLISKLLLLQEIKIDALYSNSPISSFWLTNITLAHANNTWGTQSAIGECSKVNFSNQRQTGENKEPS